MVTSFSVMTSFGTDPGSPALRFSRDFVSFSFFGLPVMLKSLAVDSVKDFCHIKISRKMEAPPKRRGCSENTWYNDFKLWSVVWPFIQVKRLWLNVAVSKEINIVQI